MKYNDSYTMYQAVKQTAKENPLGTAIFYQNTKITYRRFIRLVDRMADVLTYRFSIQKGDTVLIAQPNIPDVLICFYALNKIGAVTNFVHPFIPYNQIISIYEKTESRLAILFEQRVAKEVESYRTFAQHVVVTRIEDYLPPIKRFIYHTFMNRNIRRKLGKWRGSFKGFRYLHACKPTKQLVHEQSNDPTSTAVMLHSGSTTGDPKTICLSNGAFNFLADHVEDLSCHTVEEYKGKAMLSILPSFHGFGLGITMHLPLYNGFTVALVPKFSSKEVVKVMNKIQIGVMVAIPGAYETLLKDPKFTNHRSLKGCYCAFSGGDSMNVSLKNRFDEVMEKAGSECKVFEGYGLTESIAVICVNNFKKYKEGSIGKPIEGVEFRIIDENENEVKDGEIGEICTKSPALMLHYFKDPEATKRTYTKDGYLKTGDIGYRDEDGFIFFKQRVKRVIKVSGVGVFPSEIEKLVETVPGVIECCAVSMPDARLVNAVRLYVVAKFFDREGMKRLILEYCNKYLIRWAIPKDIVFIDELPHTLLGKVDFKKLQQETDKEFNK